LGARCSALAVDALSTSPKYLFREEREVPVVEIYTKTFCPYCWRAKSLLESKGVEYKEIAVDFGGETKQHMVQRANGRTTVPQIFIGERHIGGCDDLMALDREGQLDQLLAA
jgi:glutaredoxin 3